MAAGEADVAVPPVMVKYQSSRQLTSRDSSFVRRRATRSIGPVTLLTIPRILRHRGGALVRIHCMGARLRPSMAIWDVAHRTLGLVCCRRRGAACPWPPRLRIPRDPCGSLLIPWLCHQGVRTQSIAMADPAVRSCVHYMDDVGHLSTNARGRGRAIARCYRST
jgi:hypothetical protein